MYNQSIVYTNVCVLILKYTKTNQLFYTYHYKQWYLMSLVYKQTFLTLQKVGTCW